MTRPSNHSLPYRLAALDIDGTLLGPGSKLGAANIAAVARLRAKLREQAWSGVEA